MFWTLLQKDLRRALRNPGPLLINLALPLSVTALVGFTFGSSNESGGIGKIKIAVADEDKSLFSQFLSGAFNQGDAKKYLQVEWLSHDASMQRIQDNQVSAVVVIPENFSASYLTAQKVPPLRLIKNPAQSFYPAIVEELLQVAVEGLNGLRRNFQSELDAWVKIVEAKGIPDMVALSKIMLDLGDKFELAEDYLFPPLISYGTSTKETKEKEESDFNLFAFLLPGLASMFLFFTADNCVRDLYREYSNKTLNRYRSLHSRMLPFILSKVGYAAVVVVLCAVILFMGGGVIFGIAWKNPLVLVLLIFSFGLFASGFTAFLAAIARKEERADMMNSIVILGISFIGGSLFPVEQLPAFLRENVSPFLPNYWFIQSIHFVQFGSNQHHWLTGFSLLTGAGLVFAAAASVLFQKFLTKGVRA